MAPAKKKAPTEVAEKKRKVEPPSIESLENQEKARVQGPAPNFTAEAVVNGEFKKVSLSDYEGQYVVLFSYPFDFTFVCPTEIIAFSERAEEFKKINCQLLAFSCDSKFVHLAWTKTKRAEGGLGDINYPLIADTTTEISQLYDVYLPNEGCPLRGLFIIDGKRVVRQITKNDLPVGRSVDEVLRLVKAFQFTDKHGEVCPANWNPETNADTMQPDPKGSQKYFTKKFSEGK